MGWPKLLWLLQPHRPPLQQFGRLGRLSHGGEHVPREGTGRAVSPCAFVAPSRDEVHGRLPSEGANGAGHRLHHPQGKPRAGGGGSGAVPGRGASCASPLAVRGARGPAGRGVLPDCQAGHRQHQLQAVSPRSRAGLGQQSRAGDGDRCVPGHAEPPWCQGDTQGLGVPPLPPAPSRAGLVPRAAGAVTAAEGTPRSAPGGSAPALPCRDSCQKGWRLLYILTAYYKCSEVLRPFLLAFLRGASGRPELPFHGRGCAHPGNL